MPKKQKAKAKAKTKAKPPAAKPAAKTAAKTAAKPAVKPAAKPAGALMAGVMPAKLAAKPADKPADTDPAGKAAAKRRVPGRPTTSKTPDGYMPDRRGDSKANAMAQALATVDAIVAASKEADMASLAKVDAIVAAAKEADAASQARVAALLAVAASTGSPRVLPATVSSATDDEFGTPRAEIPASAVRGGTLSAAAAAPAYTYPFGVRVAPDETVILLHPPVSLYGVSIGINRGCRQNDSLANGYIGVGAALLLVTAASTCGLWCQKCCKCCITYSGCLGILVGIGPPAPNPETPNGFYVLRLHLLLADPDNSSGLVTG